MFFFDCNFEPTFSLVQWSSSSSSLEETSYFIESIRHSNVTPTLITAYLIKLCDSKINCTEDLLIKFANIIVENLICESPLSEILRQLDSVDFYKKLFNHQQFDFNKFLIVCRYLCSSDKQGILLYHGFVFHKKSYLSFDFRFGHTWPNIFLKSLEKQCSFSAASHSLLYRVGLDTADIEQMYASYID